MARIKYMIAALAAAGLTLAQPAAAAARTGSPIGESEAQADGPGSGMVIGLLGLVGVVFLIMAITGDDNDSPSSP